MTWLRLAGIGFILVCLAGAVVYGIKSFKEYGDAREAAGVQKQKTADLTAAVALGVKRDKIDAKNKHATAADWCHALGGTQWVQSTGECN